IEARAELALDAREAEIGGDTARRIAHPVSGDVAQLMTLRERQPVLLAFPASQRRRYQSRRAEPVPAAHHAHDEAAGRPAHLAKMLLAEIPRRRELLKHRARAACRGGAEYQDLVRDEALQRPLGPQEELRHAPHL